MCFECLRAVSDEVIKERAIRGSISETVQGIRDEERRISNIAIASGVKGQNTSVVALAEHMARKRGEHPSTIMKMLGGYKVIKENVSIVLIEL